MITTFPGLPAATPAAQPSARERDDESLRKALNTPDASEAALAVVDHCSHASGEDAACLGCIVFALTTVDDFHGKQRTAELAHTPAPAADALREARERVAELEAALVNAFRGTRGHGERCPRAHVQEESGPDRRAPCNCWLRIAAVLHDRRATGG